MSEKNNSQLKTEKDENQTLQSKQSPIFSVNTISILGFILVALGVVLLTASIVPGLFGSIQFAPTTVEAIFLPEVMLVLIVIYELFRFSMKTFYRKLTFVNDELFGYFMVTIAIFPIFNLTSNKAASTGLTNLDFHLNQITIAYFVLWLLYSSYYLIHFKKVGYSMILTIFSFVSLLLLASRFLELADVVVLTTFWAFLMVFFLLQTLITKQHWPIFFATLIGNIATLHPVTSPALGYLVLIQLVSALFLIFDENFNVITRVLEQSATFSTQRRLELVSLAKYCVLATVILPVLRALYIDIFTDIETTILVTIFFGALAVIIYFTKKPYHIGILFSLLTYESLRIYALTILFPLKTAIFSFDQFFVWIFFLMSIYSLKPNITALHAKSSAKIIYENILKLLSVIWLEIYLNVLIMTQGSWVTLAFVPIMVSSIIPVTLLLDYEQCEQYLLNTWLLFPSFGFFLFGVVSFFRAFTLIDILGVYVTFGLTFLVYLFAGNVLTEKMKKFTSSKFLFKLDGMLLGIALSPVFILIRYFTLWIYPFTIFIIVVMIYIALRILSILHIYDIRSLDHPYLHLAVIALFIELGISVMSAQQELSVAFKTLVISLYFFLFIDFYAFMSSKTVIENRMKQQILGSLHYGGTFVALILFGFNYQNEVILFSTLFIIPITWMVFLFIDKARKALQSFVIYAILTPYAVFFMNVLAKMTLSELSLSSSPQEKFGLIYMGGMLLLFIIIEGINWFFSQQKSLFTSPLFSLRILNILGASSVFAIISLNNYWVAPFGSITAAVLLLLEMILVIVFSKDYSPLDFLVAYPLIGIAIILHAINLTTTGTLEASDSLLLTANGIFLLVFGVWLYNSVITPLYRNMATFNKKIFVATYSTAVIGIFPFYFMYLTLPVTEYLISFTILAILIFLLKRTLTISLAHEKPTIKIKISENPYVHETLLGFLTTLFIFLESQHIVAPTLQTTPLLSVFLGIFAVILGVVLLVHLIDYEKLAFSPEKPLFIFIDTIIIVVISNEFLKTLTKGTFDNLGIMGTLLGSTLFIGGTLGYLRHVSTDRTALVLLYSGSLTAIFTEIFFYFVPATAILWIFFLFVSFFIFTTNKKPMVFRLLALLTTITLLRIVVELFTAYTMQVLHLETAISTILFGFYLLYFSMYWRKEAQNFSIVRSLNLSKQQPKSTLSKDKGMETVAQKEPSPRKAKLTTQKEQPQEKSAIRTCPQCNTPLDLPEQRFCKKCGYKLR